MSEPKKISILFVDDEMDFRNALASSFSRKGYNVLTAPNGKKAFEIIRSQHIDVVVSDIRMPQGDGIELLDRTKEEHHETPIILLVTGFADISTEDAHHKGAEALFSKPFDINTLLDAVERLLTPPEQRWASSSYVQLGKEIQVELQYNNFSTAIESHAVSIGRGGMFINIESHFPNINDQVNFKLTFKDNGVPLNGVGIVRWIRTQNNRKYSSGFGLEFIFLNESERKMIIEYINSRKKLKPFIPNN